jgi:hypothetical protein
MLLMDDDGVVAIICYKAILEKKTMKYGDKALWLFRNGGYVERFKLKKTSLNVWMKMGTRFLQIN